jgi:hypothetical protein
LSQALGSRAQRLKQCIAVLPGRIEDSGGNADVMFLCLAGIGDATGSGCVPTALVMLWMALGSGDTAGFSTA